MMRWISLTLTCALLLAPVAACTHVPKAPIVAAPSTEARVIEVLDGYAILLDAATALVRDPRTPVGIKTALVRAERRATPAVQTLGAAYLAFLRARAGLDPVTPRTANAAAVDDLKSSTLALNAALSEAEAQTAPLRALVEGAAP